VTQRAGGTGALLCRHGTPRQSIGPISAASISRRGDEVRGGEIHCSHNNCEKISGVCGRFGFGAVWILFPFLPGYYRRISSNRTRYSFIYKALFSKTTRDRHTEILVLVVTTARLHLKYAETANTNSYKRNKDTLVVFPSPSLLHKHAHSHRHDVFHSKDSLVFETSETFLPIPPRNADFF
jgi:hypothetical protein